MNDATKRATTVRFRAKWNADATRSSASRDRQEIEEPEERSDKRADDADRDEPIGPASEVSAVIGRAGQDVEHQARHPGTNRDRDEDRVKGMAIRSRDRSDRVLGASKHVRACNPIR